jgi:hypothetical protein
MKKEMFSFPRKTFSYERVFFFPKKKPLRKNLSGHAIEMKDYTLLNFNIFVVPCSAIGIDAMLMMNSPSLMYSCFFKK